jgi:hypothetical protein
MSRPLWGNLASCAAVVNRRLEFIHIEMRITGLAEHSSTRDPCNRVLSPQGARPSIADGRMGLS